ncbi:MAG: FAD-binding oxidoreductase, partial [Proteobacteria bacterium]
MMNLVSPDRYWWIKNGAPKHSDTVHESTTTDALVVGAGISGALIAHSLTQKGIPTLMIDRFDPGAGSTSASTALIQYEPDATLQELDEQWGDGVGSFVYRYSYESLKGFEKLTKKFKDVEGSVAPNFYFGRKSKDAQYLEREAELRSEAGLPTAFWDRERIGKHFSFSRPGAVVSDYSLQVDPFLMTQSLIRNGKTNGLRFADRTTFKKFKHDGKFIVVELENGKTIRTRHLIMAVGYEATQY